jgi:DNA (cytosine-5)-methyltransferase 1
MNKHLFKYKWNLADGYPAEGINQHGLKVFGTFICGGGSTMGYKLAGYNHLGGVEIDPKIAKVYKANHNPKYLYVEDIRDFAKRNDYPEELYNLDILDGSPPCSSFSMAGNREKDWGKKKKFREGQSLQTLDDLFFDYIALAKKLQPKVIIAENVKGLIQGNAKSYVKKINSAFIDAGYQVQLFLLNAASMGVPQKRERVFFICQRKDFNYPKLKLEFSFEQIPFIDITDDNDNSVKITERYSKYWDLAKEGQSVGKFMTKKKVNSKEPIGTITANVTDAWHYKYKRTLNNTELCQCGTYPLDYDFQEVEPKYLIGMSVPPVMTAQIANQIYLQWLKKEDNNAK